MRPCAPRKTEKERRADDREKERVRERGGGVGREREGKKSEKRERAPRRMLKKASSS